MVEIINGVVLRTIKYSDNLMIADIYTLQHGRRSFLLPVTRSKRSRVRSVLFQPLSIITFSASTNARSLARISDAQPLLLYSTIPYDVVKSSIALYLAEVLTYALHEQQSDEALFTYIDRALTWFDAASDGYADFHLVFMAQMLRLLPISCRCAHLRSIENCEGSSLQPSRSTIACISPIFPLYARAMYLRNYLQYSAFLHYSRVAS